MALRSIKRVLIPAILLVMLSTTPGHSLPNHAKESAKQTSGPVASSVFYPEVRLRKLHLVRPDLIPYPIYYKVYC